LRTFASLHSPTFRLWFFGSAPAIFGNWIQITALGFLVFDLTHSVVYLGITGFSGGVSAWFFTLYAGAVADHTSRRTILLWTQTLSMSLGIVLALLTLSHVIVPWHIVLLSFLLGAVNAFESPARQAFVSELVDKELYGNAISLNSCLFNTGTIFGPALSGILYASIGPAWCFSLNVLLFLPQIGTLYALKLPHRIPEIVTHTKWHAIKHGVTYSLQHQQVKPVLGIVALVSMFGFSVFSLMPAWAVSILHGNAATNGMLQSARGGGALIGALIMATFGHGGRKGRLLCAGAIIYPFMLVMFAMTTSLTLSLILVGLIGACFIIVYNTANTLLQSIAPDQIRGRVMGIYMLSFLGTAPVGSLVGGIAAHTVGERNAVLLCAVTALSMTALLVAASPLLRQAE